MQFFYPLLLAAPLPPSAFAQEQESWNAHRHVTAGIGMSVRAMKVDGTLRYRHERPAGVYYAAEPGAGFAPTADVQRVASAGNNKDRGPASFHASRPHWEV